LILVLISNFFFKGLWSGELWRVVLLTSWHSKMIHFTS